MEKIEDFIKKHQHTYIYGSSKEHEVIVDYYRNKGCLIDGLVVSDDHWNANKSVYKLDEIVDANHSIGVIIAVLDKYYNDVIPHVLKSGVCIEDVFFLDLGKRNYIYTLYGEQPVYSTLNFNMIKKQYFEYCNVIAQKAHGDKYNIYCGHFDLGDLVFAFKLKDRFEKNYGTSLNYIIDKKHECIAEICGIDNYTVIDRIMLANIKDVPQEFRGLLNTKMFDQFLSSVPLKGTVFTIPFTHRTRRLFYEKNFCVHFAQWLNLEESPVEPPDIRKCKDSLMDKLLDVGITDLNKVVLLAPEANSMKIPPKEIWGDILKKANCAGYKVITNAVNMNNHISGTIHIDMSLEELFELGGNCNSVYSMRSGLCDCIAGIGDRLHVLYWNEFDKDYLSLNKNFVLNSEVDEILISEFV